MNFKNLISAALTAGVLFSVFSRDNLAYGESPNNQKTNSQKSILNSDLARHRHITHTTVGSRIISQFSVKDSRGEKIDLAQLASQLGYDHFNWVNYVEKDPHGIADIYGKTLSTPYNDPPQDGYLYNRADRLPFYWDIVNCDRCKQRYHFQHHKNLQQFDLIFQDAPSDYRLQPGESIEFITNLVGVKKIDLQENHSEWEVIHTFRWKLTASATKPSQVSLVDADVDFSQISPTLINKMVSDGATLPTSIEVANVN